MILGIGTDLTDIRRIEKLLERFGRRFEERVYTQGERAYAHRRKGQEAAAFAKRFAAKEAALKALGCGLRERIGWRDIEILNDTLGKPQLLLHGQAQRFLQSKLRKGQIADCHLSLSDSPPYAQAFVVITVISPLMA